MPPTLGRVLIYTRRMDEMAAFYAHHFGYVVLRSETDRIVELRPQAGGLTILLHPAASSQKEGQALVKLVFDVEDVDAFRAASKEKGLAFGKAHKSDGYAFAEAKDPAGNSIQV